MNTQQKNISKAIMNIAQGLERIKELAPVFWFGNKYASVERATIMPNGKHETDAEHVLNFACTAVAYATKYHPELDPYKVAFYCLFHDGDEAFVSDENSLGMSHADLEAKKLREAAGRAQWHKEFAAYPEFMKLIDDMDDLKVPEYAFGKAFDKILPGYLHASNNYSLKDLGVSSYSQLVEACRASDERMAEYAAAFPDVLQIRAAMHTKVAKDAFGEQVTLE